MTRESFGRKVDLQKMKKFIRERLSSVVRRVVIEEMFPSNKAVVTEALLDLLFNTCPKIRSIVVSRCDFSKVSVRVGGWGTDGLKLRVQVRPCCICRTILTMWYSSSSYGLWVCG